MSCREGLTLVVFFSILFAMVVPFLCKGAI
jgi:hypothetical protein